MHILGIAIATMVAVAIAVFAMEYYMYRKHHAKRENKLPKGAAAKTRQAPLASRG